ncbi:MAG: kelch repeat-containing protein, partial [Chloroflexota bacterium]
RYDPATYSRTLSTSLANEHYGHTATLLPNGHILVTGGGDFPEPPITSVELYDPATNSWSTAPDMAITRFDHTATLMLDGRVLIVGGRDPVAVASAEIYDRGLGFDEAWRPRIGTISNPVLSGSHIKITGYQFRGEAENSSGSPLVQLYSLVNEQTMWLPPAVGLGWGDGHFTSGTVNHFPQGPALVTLFANGIPGRSAFVQVVNGVVWSNNSGDGNWSTAANWSSNAPPTGMDTVVFNASTTADAFIDPTFSGSVNGIFVEEGYSGEISMGRSLDATTGLVLRDGTILVSDPNNHLLTLGWNAQHTGGFMEQTQPVGVADVTFLQIENGYGRVRYRGAEIDSSVTGTDVGDVMIRIRGLYVNTYCTTEGSNSPPYARRCFEFTATGSSGPVDLTLYAPTSELNGIPEDRLAVYRYEGTPWTEYPSSNGNDGGEFSYGAAQVPGFSHFLLAETGLGQEPTAVSLHTLTATNHAAGWLALITAVLLLLGPVWRRRQH